MMRFAALSTDILVAFMTRPDIAFTMSILSKFNQNPQELVEEVKAVDGLRKSAQLATPRISPGS